MGRFGEKLKTGISKFQKAIETEWFIYAVGAIAAITSMAGFDVFGLGIMVLLMVFVFVTKTDIKCVLPPLMMFCFVLSTKHSPIRDVDEYYLKLKTLIPLGILAFLLAASIVYAFIKRKLKVRLTANFYGFAAISVAFIFGGLFSKGYKPISMAAGLLLTVCFLGSFCLFQSFIKKKDFDYIAKIIITASMVICAELLHFYIITPAVRVDFDKELIVMGWGISNAIGIMIVMGMPFVIYYMANSKYPMLFFVLLVIQIIAAVFTFARGALIIAVPLAVAGCVYALFKSKGKQRLQLICIAAGIVAVIGILLIIKWNAFVDAMSFFTETGFKDRGRFWLFNLAMEHFSSAPFLGLGIMNGFGEVGVLLTLYHNTFAQFMGWSGIVGLLAYCAHIVIVFLTIIIRPNEKRSFMGIAVLCVFVNSLLDCVIFYPYLTFMYTIFIAIAEDDATENSGGKFSLFKKMR